MKTYLSTKLKAKGADHARVINRAIETAKPFTTLMFPDGEFALKSPIIVHDRSIKLEGAENTQLWTYHEGDGITVTQKQIAALFEMERIMLGGASKQSGHGMVIRTQANIKDCHIRDFGGDGLNINGNVENGTGASFGSYQRVKISSCGGYAINVYGPDANCIGFYHVDFRDCAGGGIYENSFLGNVYVNCMGHVNGEPTWKLDQDKWRGNFYMPIESVNNRSTFIGCYSEEGSPPDEFAGCATVLGGMIGEARTILKGQWATGQFDGSARQSPFDISTKYVKTNLEYYATDK